MFSIISLIIQIVIWAFTFVFHLIITAAQLLWGLTLELIPPLAARFGESHEKNKRKMLIESVPSEKWGDCFNNLLEYRDLCFGADNADARTFDGNVSVRYQMEQAIKDEFGMDIGKYMKDNDINKLELLISDMEQYILGNTKPSKKYQKMNGSFKFKKNTDESSSKNAENYSRTNTGTSGNYRKMPTGYFADCKTQNDVQQRFSELSNAFNPNFGTSPNETMYQNILEQYQQAIAASGNK